MATEQEQTYEPEVFERLRSTLDVALVDGAAHAVVDDCIRPNYDVRHAGLFLKSGQVLDALDWLPACDLEGGPDPLTTPALPFPFTARQLAAFMLDGWGWHLAERFAGEDGQLDMHTVKELLGGVRDGKPREAIAATFAALADARQRVGEPVPSLSQAEQAARVALEEAPSHNWREPCVSGDERDARAQRRNALTPDAKAALRSARAARENAHVAWRKAMVGELLRNKVVGRGAPIEESAKERAARRLTRFRALGGEMRKAGDTWHCNGGRRGALAALVSEEKVASRVRSDRRDVKRDLLAAMGVH